MHAIQQDETKISIAKNLRQKEDKGGKNKKLGVQNMLREALSPCQAWTPILALAF